MSTNKNQNLNVPSKSTKRKKNRKPKKKLQINAEGFGMKGSLFYEKVSVPTAIGMKGKSQPQSQQSVGGGEEISGSSIICSASQVDACVAINVNAGLADIFPQLAPQANLYSEYRFVRLDFKYVNRVSTQTDGQIGLAFNSNVQSPPVTSWSELVSYEKAAFTPLWCPGAVLNVGSDLWKYTRKGDYPVDTDPKTYDWGVLSILTDGMGEGLLKSPGFIQADYVVQLRKRVLTPPAGCELAPRDPTPITAVSNSFDPSQLFTGGVVNQLVQTFFDGNTGLFYIGFPAGYWLMETNVSCDATTIVDIQPFSITPMAGEQIEIGGNTNFCGPTNAIDAAGFGRFLWGLYVPIGASGNPLISTNGWVEVDSSGAIPGLTQYSWDTMICRMPPERTPMFPTLGPSEAGTSAPRPLSQRHSAFRSCVLKTVKHPMSRFRKTRLGFLQTILDRYPFDDSREWFKVILRAELVDCLVRGIHKMPGLSIPERFAAVNGLSDAELDRLLKAL